VTDTHSRRPNDAYRANGSTVEIVRRRRLVIHIGMEKTGSTHIQRTLYHNRERLRNDGIALLETAKHPNNRAIPYIFADLNLRDDYFLDREILTAQAAVRYLAGIKEKLAREIGSLAPDIHTVVVSSEHFHSRMRNIAGLERLKAFLSDYFDEFAIVLFLREQSVVLKGLYSEALKNGRKLDRRAFFERMASNDDYFDYEALVDRWRHVFGASSIRLGLYEAYSARPDMLFRRFRELAGIRTSDLQCVARCDNRRLSPAGERIFGWLAASFPRHGTDDSGRRSLSVVVGMKLRQVAIRLPPRLIYGPVPATDEGHHPILAALKERYREGNFRVAMTYASDDLPRAAGRAP
jgi:hypothetical protein